MAIPISLSPRLCLLYGFFIIRQLITHFARSTKPTLLCTNAPQPGRMGWKLNTNGNTPEKHQLSTSDAEHTWPGPSWQVQQCDIVHGNADHTLAPWQVPTMIPKPGKSGTMGTGSSCSHTTLPLIFIEDLLGQDWAIEYYGAQPKSSDHE